ncbi:MAG: hypothetical protein BWY77_00566 [bacterium ADurb.Bin431]|nr:MAG: hypothetical protein BWY77_00566 [bacterium ADurb.Bin431]
MVARQIVKSGSEIFIVVLDIDRIRARRRELDATFGIGHHIAGIADAVALGPMLGGGVINVVERELGAGDGQHIENGSGHAELALYHIPVDGRGIKTLVGDDIEGSIDGDAGAAGPVEERTGNVGQVIDGLPHLLHAEVARQSLLGQIDFVGPGIKDRFQVQIERQLIALHVDAELASVDDANRAGADLEGRIAQGTLLALDVLGRAPIRADAALEADFPAVEDIGAASLVGQEAEKIGNGIRVLAINVGLGTDGIRNPDDAGFISHIGAERRSDGGGAIDIGI